MNGWAADLLMAGAAGVGVGVGIVLTAAAVVKLRHILDPQSGPECDTSHHTPR